MDILERVLARPYYVTREWLRVDPNFRGLRGEARFERLVSGGKVVS